MALSEFYGPATRRDATLVVIHGNCQAESLRVMLDGGGVQTVRIPPVHELNAADLPHLHRWLGAADVLVAQPVRDDFNGQRVGTRQLGHPRTLLVPMLHFAGLYPTQVIIRPPSDPSLVPPLAPYHDLRGLAAAAGRRLRAPTVADVRAIAAASLDELRDRERRHDTVVASDLFDRPAWSLMRTINHPGNGIWRALATRVRAALDLPEHDVEPGRPLLDEIHAPRDPVVAEAFGLGETARPHWVVRGRPVAAATVRAAHARWYADHPDAVRAGLARHAATVALLEDRRVVGARTSPAGARA